jgi:hypothetical protein
LDYSLLRPGNDELDTGDVAPLIAGQEQGGAEHSRALTGRAWQCPLRTRSQPLAASERTVHIPAMTTFLTILLVLAMLGVLTVLGLGVVSMLRGGDPRRSNKLMQGRVIMQGLALLLLAILMLLAHH